MKIKRVIDLKDCSITTCFMVMECVNGLTESRILVSGAMVLEKVLEFTRQNILSILEASRTTYFMELVAFLVKTIKPIKVNGKKVSAMVKAN
jgi:predicted transcriptional regulator